MHPDVSNRKLFTGRDYVMIKSRHLLESIKVGPRWTDLSHSEYQIGEVKFKPDFKEYLSQFP